MYQSTLGTFDGSSWEALCQQVFKLKHGDDGYQPIPPDPGDFGLEGFTLTTRIGFQCYCPDKHYTANDLYEAQRTKITSDIKKLKTYEAELGIRLGGRKIKDWYFVTPVISKHALLTHARNKEEEARGWKLSILDDEFTIHLRDGDFYLKEINQVKSSTGIALTFDQDIPALAPLTGPQQEYETNLLRKSQLRIPEKIKSSTMGASSADDLFQLTLNTFLEGDGYLKRIEEQAPHIHVRVCRIINEFEYEVKEKKSTWEDTPDKLTEYVRNELSNRIEKDLHPDLDSTVANQISRHIVARWLAVCQLDFIE